eukprot:scaffold50791_cov26-Tisochrysis_lutea.AAC.2
MDSACHGQATEHRAYSRRSHRILSVQVIYLIGWAPHESQQRPLARGSAQLSLKDLGLPDDGAGRIKLDDDVTDLGTMLGGKPKDEDAK